MMRRSSPVTATGSRRIHTGFPLDRIPAPSSSLTRGPKLLVAYPVPLDRLSLGSR